MQLPKRLFGLLRLIGRSKYTLLRLLLVLGQLLSLSGTGAATEKGITVTNGSTCLQLARKATNTNYHATTVPDITIEKD